MCHVGDQSSPLGLRYVIFLLSRSPSLAPSGNSLSSLSCHPLFFLFLPFFLFIFAFLFFPFLFSFSLFLFSSSPSQAQLQIDRIVWVLDIPASLSTAKWGGARKTKREIFTDVSVALSMLGVTPPDPDRTCCETPRGKELCWKVELAPISITLALSCGYRGAPAFIEQI